MFELEQASRGGAALFRSFHILKALWLIQQLEPVGRKELAERTGIGEGSVRKLVSYLEERNWAKTERPGIRLAPVGKNVLEEIGLIAGEVEAGKITVGERDFCIRLRPNKKLSGKGIEQRDEAMKAGASGATTLVFEDELLFADGFKAVEADKFASKAIVERFKVQKGDVLIIGSSPELESAIDGAFAAAVLTLDS